VGEGGNRYEGKNRGPPTAKNGKKKGPRLFRGRGEKKMEIAAGVKPGGRSLLGNREAFGREKRSSYSNEIRKGSPAASSLRQKKKKMAKIGGVMT